MVTTLATFEVLALKHTSVGVTRSGRAVLVRYRSEGRWPRRSQPMTTVTLNIRAHMGHATPDGHQAVAVEEIVTVPVRAAVQMSSAPCGGGEGVGSPSNSPSGSTVTWPHWVPAPSSVSLSDPPTRSWTARPESASVRPTTTDEPPPPAVDEVTIEVAVPALTVVEEASRRPVVVLPGVTDTDWEPADEQPTAMAPIATVRRRRHTTTSTASQSAKRRALLVPYPGVCG